MILVYLRAIGALIINVGLDTMCPLGHTLRMQVKDRSIEYYKTPGGKEPAKDWMTSVKDKLTQAILYKRIRQAGLGQFGKTRSVGGGVQEMKIDYGPGYRIYFGIHNDELVIILMAGSKRTQQSDIEKARTYWTQWKDQIYEK